MIAWLHVLPSRGLVYRETVLGLVTLAAFFVAGPIGYVYRGSMGILAAAIAGIVCFLGAAAALGIHHVAKGPEGALAALWMGMTVRMGLPLACAIFVLFGAGPLADAGFVGYLLGFYLATLATGTALSLPSRRERPSDAKT